MFYREWDAFNGTPHLSAILMRCPGLRARSYGAHLGERGEGLWTAIPPGLSFGRLRMYSYICTKYACTRGLA